MKSNRNNLSTVLTMALFLLTASFLCIFHKPEKYSISERRILQQFPKLSAKTLSSGDFAEAFEAYASDQFPFRDSLRTLKAVNTLFIFNQSDYNGIYLSDGFLSETEYPLNEVMLKNAADKFAFLYETYLKDTDTDLYFSIVPDKNYFLAKKSGHLSLDYQQLVAAMKDAAPYMSYIDIFPSLSADAYYRTDTHWKQECLLDTADVLLAAMKNTSSHASAGASVPPKASSEDSLEGYTLHTLDIPFYGVYHGHSALKLPADTIYYLTSDVLDQCIVTSYSSGKPVQKELYNMQKASGRDAYEMFLSGSEAFLTLENPLADTKKELVIFRDSFGSSLAPLLLKDYAKITLIDIRYIQSAYIGNFITFHDQDVLFLYSTLLLNNSEGLR